MPPPSGFCQRSPRKQKELSSYLISNSKIDFLKVQLGMRLTQFSNYLSSFYFRRVFDGSSRAYSITTSTEYYTIVWIFHDRPLFALILFKFVCAEFAVVYAFSAADAFFIVYCWIPGYLASGNSVPSFLRHLL